MTRSEILQISKPILFNTEMVRALLDGRKTMTRRVIKVNFKNGEAGYKIVRNTHTGEFCYLEVYDEWESEMRRIGLPYKPGDCLYVRETWERLQCANCDGGETDQCFNVPDSREGCYVYRATHDINGDARWRPSIHMPKETARIFLRVKDVCVERLNEISIDEIAREGIQAEYMIPAFHNLWDSTIKPKDRDKYGWTANPWVWVIAFERVEVTE